MTDLNVKNPDLHQIYIEHGAQCALMGLFWCTTSQQKTRDSLLKGLSKGTTPLNIFAPLFAAQHAQMESIRRGPNERCMVYQVSFFFIIPFPLSLDCVRSSEYRLLYHFDRPFSHASRATVNREIEVFHHGSQAAVNT